MGMAVCIMLVAACPTMNALAYSASTADAATVGIMVLILQTAAFINISLNSLNCSTQRHRRQEQSLKLALIQIRGCSCHHRYCVYICGVSKPVRSFTEGALAYFFRATAIVLITVELTKTSKNGSLSKYRANELLTMNNDNLPKLHL